MAAPCICSIKDCGKRPFRRGFCAGHYSRLLRHGDPLAGGSSRCAKGEPERYYRDVVLRYEGDRCLIWPYYRVTGYGRMVCGDGKMAFVHRRLCEDTYGLPPSPDHEAAHSCGRGKRGCVSKKHLSWKTRSANQMDKVGHGTHYRGLRHHLNKLSHDDVREIRRLEGEVSANELARNYNVTFQSIRAIQLRKSWSWLD